MSCNLAHFLHDISLVKAVDFCQFPTKEPHLAANINNSRCIYCVINLQSGVTSSRSRDAAATFKEKSLNLWENSSLFVNSLLARNQTFCSTFHVQCLGQLVDSCFYH